MFTVSPHDHHQMLQCPSRPLLMERSWKPHVETAPNCPRCASSNTKFCYYNNYSFSQPRYFCKGCRRYWTKGGSLRNVPVGGGCRKSRRTKSVRPHPVSSTSYSSSGDLTSEEDSSAPQESTNGGPNIDLAMVFAKFLNQNSTFDTELAGLDQLPDAGHASVNVPTDDHHVVIEGQNNPSDVVTDSQLDEGVLMAYVDDHNLQQQQEDRIQEFPRPDDPNVFGLQALLSDPQVVEDALWSDATTALPSFTWQPMVQLQEFDQTLAMNHLMSDSWSSSFDLPSYEVFSRP